ncbi:hypothetical protein F5Y08DRAFT_94826 [Xylaria arbuscula]|nr:hypothetical protein F5Y08DRAFT_94826 [Xylaria arbuscula]
MEKEGKGKGKGKEGEENRDIPVTTLPAKPDSSDTDTGPHDGTPFSRFASSAASLASGLVSGRADGQQSRSILSSDKAGSSSTAKQPSTALHEAARVTHTNSPSVQLQLGSTFRSGAGQDGESSEQSFSTFLATGSHGNGLVSGNSPIHKTSDAELAALNDGSEVIHLLGSDSTMEDDDIAPSMTDDELSALRMALFEDGSTRRTPWNDVLDFIPEFLSGVGGAEQLAQHMGVPDADEARNIWFSQWGVVLSSYTDEVWGDLNPLVTAARQELQEASTSPDTVTASGLNAVRRLRQILAHVRGQPT